MKRSQKKSVLAIQKKNWSAVKWFSTSVGILMLTACLDREPLKLQNPTNESEPQAAAAESAEQEVAFQFDLSAQLTGKIQFDSQETRSIQALAPGVMTGTMFIENMDTGETESRPWVIQVDDSPFPNVDSITGTVLKPGVYTFTLSAISGQQQYIGSAVHQIFDDASDNNIPMLIRPVIGDPTIDVTIRDSLIEFGFSFPPNEIDTAGLIDPAIAVSIDGGAETFFILNPATGLSDDLFFVNLVPGEYNIALKFFDAGFQVGKSVSIQEFVTVTGGLDINMDIVPLFGEINFNFFTEGTDATVEVFIPADVVDETGGLGNLTSILRVVGNNTAFFETPLSLTQVGANYSASAVIPQLSYDDITYEILFIDNVRAEEIGSCIANGELTAFGRTINCPVFLERRSVITGSLLSKLGINVFSVDGLPLPGAIVRIDGAEAGITGGSALATPGYTRLNVAPGPRLISAEFAGEIGEILYDSIPLNVTSLNLFMGQTANVSTPILEDDFIGPQSGTASPMNYWFGCNGQGTPAFSHDNNGKLELMSQFQDPDFDYCLGTSAITEHSFTDIEITDAGGFQVSLDIAWSDDPTSGLAIGIGEEAANDIFNFDPIPSVDAMVDILENEVVVRIFDNGIVSSVSSYATAIPAAELSNVTVDVQTDSFAPGAPATLMVLVNGTAIPSIDFMWDGGSNHIEVRGGTTATEPAMVSLEKLTVRPR